MLLERNWKRKIERLIKEEGVYNLESRIKQQGQIIINEYNETGYLEERIRLVVTIKRVMRIINKVVEKRCNIY